MIIKLTYYTSRRLLEEQYFNSDGIVTHFNSYKDIEYDSNDDGAYIFHNEKRTLRYPIGKTIVNELD